MYGVKCKLKSGPRTARRKLYEEAEVDPNALFTSENVSPYGLLEELFVRNPWRLLISAILLNRTHREQVDFVMFTLLEEYPDAASMESANPSIISRIIRPLGIRYRRADTLIRFSKEFIRLTTRTLNYGCSAEAEGDIRHNLLRSPFELTRTDIMGLYGCGAYAADVYEIFILEKYEDNPVADHALHYYIDYKRGITEK